MAEDHRRVEARNIVGTGMATDPERLEQIKAETERRARAWRPAPAASFGAVLERTPAAVDEDAPADLVEDEAAAGDESVVAVDEANLRLTSSARSPERASPRAPDPRQRALNALLDKQQGGPAKSPPSPRISTGTDTPPTGTAGPTPPRRPRS